MSADPTESLYITVDSGKFKGQHWPPHDEDDAKAEMLWLDSLDEYAHADFDETIASALEQHFTRGRPSEKPPSIPPDFYSARVSESLPYPFGPAGSVSRVAVYRRLRTMKPSDRQRAEWDLRQSVVAWKRERESETQDTKQGNQSQGRTTGGGRQAEGEEEDDQTVRQNTQEQNQRGGQQGGGESFEGSKAETEEGQD